MKILIICDSFFPKRNAPSNRFLSFISYWSKDNKIYLITKDTKKKDLDKIRHLINIDNIKLFSSSFFFKKQRIFFKFLNLLIFFLFSLWSIFKLKKNKIDTIISTSPPLITFIIGYSAKLFFNSKFILETRDIWSDSLKDLGIIKNSFLIYLIKCYENFFYKRATTLVSVSYNIKNRIKFEKDHHVITNFTPIDFIKYNYSKNIFNNKYYDKSNINILYLGTLGLSHEFDSFINTLNNYDCFNLNIVGEGLSKEKIINKIEAGIYKNTTINDYTTNFNEIINYYLKTDFCLIILKDLNIFKTVIPSKLFEYSFFKKPILYFGPKNEASELINKYKLGICAHDSIQLKNILYSVKTNFDDSNLSLNFDKFNNDFSTKKISLKYLNDVIY